MKNNTGKMAFATRKMVFAALMAALVMAGSAIRITIPISIGGTTSFHLGNVMCALSGILLGPAWGAGAAGIGSMLYDWTNPLYFSESWITLLTKAAYGLVAGIIAQNSLKQNKTVGYSRALLASVAGAVTYAVLYLSKSFFYSGLLVEGLSVQAAWLVVLGKLPATIFNAIIAIVCAPLLAQAIQPALKNSGLLFRL